MKYRVKLLLPFLCAILLVACEKDDTASSGEKDLHIHGLKEKHISMKDLEAMPKAIEALEKVRQKKSKAKNNKNAYDPDNDFFINTDSILLIENGPYSSLTFPIFRLEDKGVLENLVLSKDNNGDYTAALYEYNLTPKEKESIKQGEPTFFTNPVKRTDIVFDDSHLNKSLIQVWYTDIVVIRCSSGDHGEKNFGEWHQCIAAQKPQILVITRSVVIDDGSGEGGWTSGGNYGGGGSGSGGSGSGGGSGPYNPNIPAFNPDTDMALVEGRITRPQLALPTGEQNFYNIDLGGANIGLRYLMNIPQIRIPLLQYLTTNQFSTDSKTLAVNILNHINDGKIEEVIGVKIIKVAIQNSITAQDIIEFLAQNDFSQVAKDIVQQAMNDIISGAVPANILNLIDKECPKNIIKDILNVSSPFTNLIQSTFGIDETVNLSFVNSDLPNQAGAAATSPILFGSPDSYAIQIKFSNSYLDEATNLAIVASALHEMVHAYLIDLYYKGKLISVNANYTELLNAFIAYYADVNQNTYNGLEDEIHNAMEDFIQKMANSIYNYAQTKNISGVTPDYCIGLAWSTMYGYGLYDDVLTEQQKVDYAEIGYNEQNNAGSKKGSKCP